MNFLGSKSNGKWGGNQDVPHCFLSVTTVNISCYTVLSKKYIIGNLFIFHNVKEWNFQ